jgi:hypothetical protein
MKRHEGPWSRESHKDTFRKYVYPSGAPLSFAFSEWTRLFGACCCAHFCPFRQNETYTKEFLEYNKARIGADVSQSRPRTSVPSQNASVNLPPVPRWQITTCLLVSLSLISRLSAPMYPLSKEHEYVKDGYFRPCVHSRLISKSKQRTAISSCPCDIWLWCVQFHLLCQNSTLNFRILLRYEQYCHQY